jgi:hypothetical protein
MSTVVASCGAVTLTSDSQEEHIKALFADLRVLVVDFVGRLSSTPNPPAIEFARHRTLVDVLGIRAPGVVVDVVVGSDDLTGQFPMQEFGHKNLLMTTDAQD